jgi:DHA1 family tetracycline resistance protein-like MFS transporter
MMENWTDSKREEMPHPLKGPGRINGRLGLIFLIMLMDIIGLTFLWPVAPFIVEQYSDKALMVSMITILYAAGQFIAAPLMGKLGDRFGRRPVLLVSLVGQGIAYVIFGIGGALWVLFLGRLIGGITGGNLSTASAYIADISKPEERTKNFTLIGIAWSLGLILGPAIGGLFTQINLAAPAYAAAILSFVNVFLSYFFLPESLPAEHREITSMKMSDLNPIVAIFDMARKPGLGWLLLVTCLFSFAFNGISSTSSVFLIDKFGAQAWQVSLLLTLGGVSLAVVQFLFVQQLVKRFGDRRIAIASLVGQAVNNLTIFFAPAFWWIFPISMVNSATSGFTFPTLTTLTTNRVQPREVGLLMGVTTGLGSLMNIFGPLWAGVVYDRVGLGAPYWMGAVIFLLAAGVLWVIREKQPQTAIPETAFEA